jgi:ABC-type anion transport system duplicated permease subunit
MTILLVILAVLVAINLGVHIAKLYKLGEKSTEAQIARAFLSLITFVLGSAMIDTTMWGASFFVLLLSLVLSHWDYNRDSCLD